jgi:hypothetical protein
VIVEILIFFLLLSNIITAIFYFQSLLKIKYYSKKVFDTTFENLLFKGKNDFEQNEKVDNIHQENFIKFLSDSRDWAFEYIDKSQKQIKEFVDMADKEFAFFDAYGVVLHNEVSYETMKKISEEYKKLKNLLPEELDDRR